MKNELESFEVTEYDGDLGDGDEEYDKFAAIKQAIADMPRDNPSSAVMCRLTGDRLVLQYHSYEMFLTDPRRLRGVQDQGEDALKDALKYLKKQVKSSTKATLSVKELKDEAGNSIQKASLNERYVYLAWRVFELS